MKNDHIIYATNKHDLYNICYSFYGNICFGIEFRKNDKLLERFILDLLDSGYSWNDCNFLRTHNYNMWDFTNTWINEKIDNLIILL